MKLKFLKYILSLLIIFSNSSSILANTLLDKLLTEREKLLNFSNDTEVEEKIEKINKSINILESREFTGKYIIVNIPSMMLYAYEDNNLILSSKVVVGHPKRKTPLITTKITSIKYNPDWSVPPGITSSYRKKLLNEGISYFKNKNIKITYKNGNAYFWQPPGEFNALGLLKFELDNPYNIYIHDTNERFLFEKNDRAQSSGCIRVEKYIELAAWVLNKSIQNISNNISTKKTYWEKLNEPIIVHIIYALAWPEEEKIIFHKDLYNLY